MNRVSVIIPNWNGKEFLGPCLDSLYRQKFKDFDTTVVDNGSSDGSVSLLRGHYPKVTVIRLEQNRGFSAAVNAGISSANTPYIALLNNDTEVHPFWLDEIVRALDNAPQVGSAASKILFYPETESVNSAGDEFSFFGVAYQRRLRRGDSPLFDESTYVFSACAAAAVYRKDLFDKIGLFDEAFFAYHEDVDLGFRAQLAGYRCLFVPKAIVYHKYERTSSRVAGLRFYLNERNKYFVLIKNLPSRLILPCLPLIVLQELFCLIKAVWRRELGIYCRALIDVWSRKAEMLHSRRYIQSHRVVDDAYVWSLMRFKEPFGLFSSRAR